MEGCTLIYHKSVTNTLLFIPFTINHQHNTFHIPSHSLNLIYICNLIYTCHFQHILHTYHTHCCFHNAPLYFSPHYRCYSLHHTSVTPLLLYAQYILHNKNNYCSFLATPLCCHLHYHTISVTHYTSANTLHHTYRSKIYWDNHQGPATTPNTSHQSRRSQLQLLWLQKGGCGPHFPIHITFSFPFSHILFPTFIFLPGFSPSKFSPHTFSGPDLFFCLSFLSPFFPCFSGSLAFYPTSSVSSWHFPFPWFFKPSSFTTISHPSIFHHPYLRFPPLSLSSFSIPSAKSSHSSWNLIYSSFPKQC